MLYPKMLIKYQLLLLFVIISIHSFIITRLIFFPFPELFLLPYLTNKGLIPYKQIIDQHSPGLFFYPFNALSLGLSNEVMARGWLIVITILIHILIYFTAKYLTKDIKVALCANIIFFLFHAFWGGWVLWVDSFIPLILLPAFFLTYSIVSKPKSEHLVKVLMIGLLFGIAVIMKQIYLPLALATLLVLLYFKKSVKTLVFFLIGFLLLLILTLIYFYSLGALSDFIFWTGFFNLNVYPLLSRKIPEYPDLFQIAFISSPIILFHLMKNKIAALLISLFTFGTIFSLLDRFDSNHFQPTLPFFSIGFAIIIFQSLNLKVFQFYFYIYLLLSAVWISDTYSKYNSKEVIIFNETARQNAQIIKEYVNPGEEIYIFGPTPLLYYLTDTIPAGRFFVFLMPWYMHLLEEKSIEVLKNSPPELLIRDRTYYVDSSSITLFAKNLDQYIETHYETFKTQGNLELMRPKNSNF